MPSPQREVDASYAARISKTDALIDWLQPAADIDRQVRAYNPWPVAETVLDGERMRCWRSVTVEEDTPLNLPPDRIGRVEAATNDGIDVRTGQGLLRIVELQMPGRRRMPACDFARGCAIVGKVLGSGAL
jgi:methionyl-tRNA formyltransferase